VNPQKTFYTLEPMPWMHPFSPEDYLQMIKDIDRDGFAVHMDIVNMINTPEKYLFGNEFTDHAFAVLGKYIKSCHIKDVSLSPRLTTIIQETALGNGGFDLRHYIDRIDSLSPDMSVIIEHLDGEDDYIRAVAYVKSITEGADAK
jgi:sugar phosphate isomerase/epimerase